MKVAILTNDDLTGSLVFSPVLGLQGVTLAGVFFSESPMKGRRSALSAAWGLRRKMAVRYWLFLVASNGFFALFSAVGSALRLSGSHGDLDSLRLHARSAGTPVHECADFNSVEIKAQLRDLAIDLLLIRVSAILDKEVLSIPRQGTWCVHSSLLPAFGGIAGEFQALRTGSSSLGSTVFEVTERLDEGPPLAQTQIPVRQGGSLFSHIIANNRAAGRLLAAMVADLAAGRTPGRPLLNEGIEPSYFSWPTAEQVAAFRRDGRRLMTLGDLLRLGLSAVRLGRGLARFT